MTTYCPRRWFAGLAITSRYLLEQANQAVGRLDGLASHLPDLSLLTSTYVRKEAVLSSQIEGTQSSLSDLLLFENDEVPGVPTADVQEVSNYLAAINHGLTRMRSGFPLSLRLIREIASDDASKTQRLGFYVSRNCPDDAYLTRQCLIKIVQPLSIIHIGDTGHLSKLSSSPRVKLFEFCYRARAQIRPDQKQGSMVPSLIALVNVLGEGRCLSRMSLDANKVVLLVKDWAASLDQIRCLLADLV